MDEQTAIEQFLDDVRDAPGDIGAGDPTYEIKDPSGISIDAVDESDLLVQANQPDFDTFCPHKLDNWEVTFVEYERGYVLLKHVDRSTQTSSQSDPTHRCYNGHEKHIESAPGSERQWCEECEDVVRFERI